MQIYQETARRCRDKGMTIAELERKAGLGNATIAGWKTAAPRVDKLIAVAKVLDCTVNDLIIDDLPEDQPDSVPA